MHNEEMLSKIFNNCIAVHILCSSLIIFRDSIRATPYSLSGKIISRSTRFSSCKIFLIEGPANFPPGPPPDFFRLCLAKKNFMHFTRILILSIVNSITCCSKIVQMKWVRWKQENYWHIT